MPATKKSKLLIWVTVLVLIMACVPTLAAPSIPTIDPAAANTFIAQTVIAAGTRTAAALPTLTFTPSLTPTEATETASPTFTSTVIFRLSTPTPLVIPTFTGVSSGGGGGGGGGSSSSNYACKISKVSPPNGSSFSPRQDFNAVWTVKNIGQKKWDHTSVDYIYSSGDKFHKIAGYDLSSNVGVGESVDLGVDMQAPKNSGTYTTTWTMRVGSKTFCEMTLTIVVK